MTAVTRCMSQRIRVGTLQVLSRHHKTSLQQTRRIASAAAASTSAVSVSAVPPLSSRNEPVRPVTRPIPIDLEHSVPSPRDGDSGPRPTPPHVLPSRKDALREARPFSDFLTDNFNRQHDYLRISVTERCNLRCLYCMPEEGVPLSPQRELLTTPEIVLLSSVFVSQGVTKIRLTGGEPTVRRDIVPLMQQIGALRAHGLKELCLTTNGLSLHRKLDAMVEAGLTGVNLSLDTLDPWQYQLMTRRAGFSAVQKSIDKIFELNRAGAGIKFKINCVVMRGINDREILPFVEMTREKDVEVRFIEYMPFDGNKWSKGKMYGYQEMLELIRTKYPDLERAKGHKNDTSKTYQVPGFAGKVGFVTSMTHNFCGTCNRLRITSDGNLKVCLFGNAEVSVRDILRKVNQGEPIDEEAFEALRDAALAAEAARASNRPQLLPEGESLSSHLPPPPPLLAPNSEELLEVIGMAVKRKKEKHAGMGELEHMKNRPMILIDSQGTFQQPFQLTPPPRWHPVGFSKSRLISSSLPSFMIPQNGSSRSHLRLFSNTSRRFEGKHDSSPDATPKLTHVTSSGAAHMVSISEKSPTKRTATAKCTMRFSDSTALTLVRENQIKKGDVLGVARIAGIMAAKRTPDLIPLCHPIPLTHAEVDLVPVGDGQTVLEITATVSCDGKTGVEMEALTAASTAALTVYDMCKAVDKGMIIEGLRVVLKEGGKSGRWVEGVSSPSP
ncbi:putative molybdenum cofactor biosynthesis protein 1 B [Podospora australis]|uniref:Molybdenum cofactor biosynthesis protein 1 B n=1 Tax=Podospora australis TaxID=1536484 RepID=A0AAN7AMG7_9PEZI|nr:putative molybdenum cofactor biosynthesis protein 1 B [Podospora australis]